jgi:DNA-binding transcriptional regulator PaaX
MDRENQKNNKDISVAKTLLAILWKVGEGTIHTFMAHNYSKLLCGHKNKATFRTAMSRLQRLGLIQRKVGNIFVLSEKGKPEALLSFVKASILMHKPDTSYWDGGWRIIFFNVPERKKKLKGYLKKSLRHIGFFELQKSVWVYPFPVPPFLKDLIYLDDLRPHARFVTTDFIDNDEELRKLFNLRK